MGDFSSGRAVRALKQEILSTYQSRLNYPIMLGKFCFLGHICEKLYLDV